MIFYILIGVFVGCLSGMGVGGGSLLIPILTYFYSLSQQEAQKINLIYFIPTALIATITHYKNNNIEKNIVLKMVVFGVIGAILGAILANGIDPSLLKKVFGFFLLFMGIYEFFKKSKEEDVKGVDIMEDIEFQRLKNKFIGSNLEEKIDIYISTEGLTQKQYKELLKFFPINEIEKLEKALS